MNLVQAISLFLGPCSEISLTYICTLRIPTLGPELLLNPDVTSKYEVTASV